MTVSKRVHVTLPFGLFRRAKTIAVAENRPFVAIVAEALALLILSRRSR